MFCPACGVYMQEAHLFKSNVVALDDGTPVAYDAFCPNCRTELGRMHWGVLTPHPGLARIGEEPSAPPIELPAEEPEFLPAEEETELVPPPSPFFIEPRTEPLPDEEPPSPRRTSYEPYRAPGPMKYCPHCGKPLPEEY